MTAQLGMEKGSTARATRSPTDRDIGWAAGFLEGEGSFVRTTRGCGSEQCSAGQVQREPLDRLLAMFGGTLSLRLKANPKHQSQWAWSVTGGRARGVMLTLYSLLSPRRQEQALKAMRPWRPQLTRYESRKTACPLGHQYDYVSRNGRHRGCKTCRAAATKRSRERQSLRELITQPAVDVRATPHGDSCPDLQRRRE